MNNQVLKGLYATTLLVLSSFAVRAQIVYVDLNPDSIRNCSSICGASCARSFTLDINRNGVKDFSFNISTLNNCGSSPLRRAWLSVSALDTNNKVVINSNGFVDALDSNESISSSSPMSGAIRYFRKAPGNNTGWWPSGATRFVGVKLKVGTKTYYGWIKMIATTTVTSTNVTASLRALSFAYNGTSGVPILAGQRVSERPGGGNKRELFPQGDVVIAPNPFTNSTTVSFYLEQAGTMSAKVYDLNGRLVKTLADNGFEAGHQSLQWNAENAAKGMYILRIQCGEFLRTEKLFVQ